MLVIGAYNAGILAEKNARELVNSICCSPKTDACLARECTACVNKEILYNEFDDSAQVTYYQWQRKQIPASKSDRTENPGSIINQSENSASESNQSIKNQEILGESR